MTYNFSRRQFLKPFGIFVGGVAVVRSLPLISKILVASQVEAQTSPYIRQDIANWSQNQINSLKKGIQVMQSRADTDPTSWIYQANIHDVPSQDSRNLTAWRTCQHGTDFFFPWHRIYLYYFERILRKASGDPNFALPYWNYTNGTDAGRTLPAPFRNPANSSNPLYVSQRNSVCNQGVPLPSQDVSYSNAFSYTNFESSAGSGASFGGQYASGPSHLNSPHGQLETKPHDQVHVDVGGDSGWMSNTQTAARDPIFWLHHTNIDRLWEGWLQLGNGRANPTNDSVWMNTSFTFFDENAHQVTLRGQDILNTVQQLNYRYDSLPQFVATKSEPPLLATKSERPHKEIVKLSSAPLAMPVPDQKELVAQASPQRVTQLANVPVTVSVPAPASSGSVPAIVQGRATRLLLNVEGLEFNPSNVPLYDISINGNYVGKLALFGYPQGGTFSLDITDVVSPLQTANISVTIAPSAGGTVPGATASTQTATSSISFQRLSVTTG